MAYFPILLSEKNKYGIRCTSCYGWRGRGKKRNFHKGIDLAPSKNGTIHIIASQNGTLSTGKDRYGGLWSYIKGTDGRGYLTVHHARWLRRWGKVRAGDKIAIMGSSGHSTGKHVHFEIRRSYNNSASHVDPMKQNLHNFDNGGETDEMVTLDHTIKFKTKSKVNHREKPTTSSKVVQVIGKGVELISNKATNGQNIGGNTTWYHVGHRGKVGFISGAVLQRIEPNCKPIQEQLNRCRGEFDRCRQENKQIQNQLNNCNSEKQECQTNLLGCVGKKELCKKDLEKCKSKNETLTLQNQELSKQLEKSQKELEHSEEAVAQNLAQKFYNWILSIIQKK